MNNTVENKVAAGIVANIVMMVAGWLATRYGLDLPADLSAEVSGAAAVVVSAGAGWLTKHSPRTEEVLETALEVLAANGHMPGTMGSAAGAQVPSEPTDVRPAVTPATPAPVDAPVTTEDGDEIPEPTAEMPPVE